MKEVKVDITIINKKVVYIAKDGEEFSDSEDCMQYEDAKAKIVRHNYLKLVKGTTSECDLYDCGCEDYYFNIVTINSKEDIQTVAEMALWNSQCNTSKEEYAKKLKVGETYFIGTGYCNDDFYYPVTKQDIIDKLTSRLDESLEKICQKKEEKQ